MPLKYELTWSSPNADDTLCFIKDGRKRINLWHLPDAAWFQRKVPLTPKIKKKNPYRIRIQNAIQYDL